MHTSHISEYVIHTRCLCVDSNVIKNKTINCHIRYLFYRSLIAVWPIVQTQC